MKNDLVSAFALVMIAVSPSVIAAEKLMPAPSRIPAPELAPELPSRDNARVTQKDSTASADAERSAANAEAHDGISEERIESRLAVIRSGRATVTDPNVGRYDRAAGNGQRRVTPTMWQVFKF
jgi:hypothetical protein